MLTAIYKFVCDRCGATVTQEQELKTIDLVKFDDLYTWHTRYKPKVPKGWSWVQEGLFCSKHKVGYKFEIHDKEG